ncbi:MAG: PAS domain-containing protein, partial [Thermotogota bacterium]
MLSFEKVMEQSGLGFARHKVIYDKEGKPVDYYFLSVNPAFERLTGLKKKELLNRRITEVMPKITEGNFDWIDFYGQIASNGERHVFEQYSAPLDRWYRVEAFSYEQGYFTTVFVDITHERELVEASKSFLDDREGTNTYEQITHRMRRITGGKFVALNLFLEEQGKFSTSALAGVAASLQKALGFLGFNLFEKEWTSDPGCAERIRENTVATFDHLHELTGDFISKNAIRLIDKTFKLGKVAVIKITQAERILGDFTIILSNERELQNEKEAVIYADMVGMLIEKRNKKRELNESEDRFSRAIEGTGAGLWDWDMVKNKVFFSKRWKSMLGYEDHEVVNDFSGWKNLWHPEDAPRIEKSIKDFLENKTDVYEIEHRLRHKDGSWHWIST